MCNPGIYDGGCEAFRLLMKILGPLLASITPLILEGREK